MRVSNIKIGSRLAAGFGLVLALLLVVAAVGAAGMMSIKRDLDAVANVNMEKMRVNYELAEKVHIVARVMRTIVLLSDHEQKQRELAKITTARAEYDTLWAQLQAFQPSAKAAQLREAIDNARQQARTVNNQILDLAMKDDDAAAVALLLSGGIPANATWLAAVDENIEYQREQSKLRLDSAAASFTFSLWMLGGAAGAALLLGLGAGRVIGVSVTRPIGYATECAVRMARGDLTVPVERRAGFDGKDETSQLIAGMQTLHDSMVEMVSAVQANAAGVATGAQQIANSRPRHWSKRRPRWTNSPPRCPATARARCKPSPWRAAPAAWRHEAVT
jgi:methyl-accepting chemotaxis protein